jgi:hypothetical protein
LEQQALCLNLEFEVMGNNIIDYKNKSNTVGRLMGSLVKIEVWVFFNAADRKSA